jgi:U3 small nucleolar ribonucleoprotein protein LCP5
MTVEDSITTLLTTLTTALQSATAALPDSSDSFLPPNDGITLLDVKNDLLLSYLQNLVFLVIIKLRHRDSATHTDDTISEVIRKLVDLRVYLERGVRPLENKLKYQIDKVVRAAEEADRRAATKSATKKVARRPTTKELAGDVSEDNISSDAGSEDDDEDGSTEKIADISYAPRPAALLKNAKTSNPDSSRSKSQSSTTTGAYKPPRITPTSMPSTTKPHDRPDPALRKRKSHLLDEYINEELSSTPLAQPSIGSSNTITNRGRSGASALDRQKEKERLEYEEKNFVRLPGESKAERRKARARGERDRRDIFGGEDWTGLGGLGDRIGRSVASKEGRGVLDRRDKRKRDVADGPRGDGVGVGEVFEKRRKVLMGRMEKKGRRNV